MEEVWANKPYVINIGPRSKAAAVGFVDAVSGYWPKTFARFTELKASATSAPQVHANGTLAWVIGQEGVIGVMTSGKVVKYDALYTNVFEKDGGRRLMVTHHAHRIPQ